MDFTAEIKLILTTLLLPWVYVSPPLYKYKIFIPSRPRALRKPVLAACCGLRRGGCGQTTATLSELKRVISTQPEETRQK